MRKDTGLNEVAQEEISSNVLTFMYQSIADTQSVIRAIDTKLGFILVLNLIPITNLEKIVDKIKIIIRMDQSCCVLLFKMILISLCLISWILACICIYKGLGAIDNPSDHIIKSLDKSDPKGVFYSGGLFKTKFIDALFKRKGLTSSRTYNEYINDMPIEDSQIFRELSFEKMKLSYIRDIKIKRQFWSFKFTVYWIVTGIMIYILFINAFFKIQ